MVKGNITLEINPGRPLAGQDIVFTLENLTPWQKVIIEFIDPLGKPVEWITEYEARFAKVNGVPVTKRTLYADDKGQISWTRIGTLDIDGVWVVRITLDTSTTSVSYPITQLQLSVQQLEQVGVQLHRYQGFVSHTYYSALVPSSLAVDSQAHLAWVIDELWERLGLQSSQIPDIYLMGNQSLFEKVGAAVGVQAGFEDGFYKSSGDRPGIYMRADFLRTDLLNILTHEYVHLLLGEQLQNGSLPAWLNEGLAEYFENELGLLTQRPDAARSGFYSSVNSAKSAAASNTLIPLTSLESQSTWNTQTDAKLVALQYAEAHMVVRYLIEAHGVSKVVILVEQLGSGASLSASIQSVIGVSYQELETKFQAWLKAWDSSERLLVRPYLEKLSTIRLKEDSVSDRRAIALNIPLSQRIVTWQGFVSEAQQLRLQLQATNAPSNLAALHARASDNLDRVIAWLSLELEYAQTGIDDKRVQANEMIPEINARDNSLAAEISAYAYIYQIDL